MEVKTGQEEGNNCCCTNTTQLQKLELSPDDELLQTNGVEKISKAKIAIESMILNSYIYIHADERRLMSAKRSLKGFNIYDLRSNKLLCHLSANIFGTKYSMNKCETINEGIEFGIEPETFYETNNLSNSSINSNSSNSTVDSYSNNKKRIKEILPSLDVVYDVKFLKRDKPRNFKLKLGQLHLQNKQPIYNPDTNSYSLNFSGRVTVASVKNFQIVHPLEPTFITLTFGKEANDSYILDFTHPWNPLQAFCVGLTALDHKLGFE